MVLEKYEPNNVVFIILYFRSRLFLHIFYELSVRILSLRSASSDFYHNTYMYYCTIVLLYYCTIVQGNARNKKQRLILQLIINKTLNSLYVSLKNLSVISTMKCCRGLTVNCKTCSQTTHDG